MRQPVELRVDVPEPRLLLEPLAHLVVAEEGQDAGHGGRRCRRAVDQDVGSAVSDAVGIVSGRAERDIRHVAGVIVGHAGPGLPYGLGIEQAGAAATGTQPRRPGLVPGGFRNIRQGRAETGGVRGRPVGARPFHELGSSDGGDLRQDGWKIDRAARCRERHVSLRITPGRTGIARRVEDGDALGVGLLRDGTPVTEPPANFAASVTDGDERRDVQAYGCHDSGKGVGAVDVIDGGFGRDSAGPFQIQIAFDLGAGVAGVGAAIQNHLGVVGGEAKAGAERANVGDRNVGFAHHGDVLAGAVDAGLIQRPDIVDGGEVCRRQIVGGARIVVGRNAPDE